MIEGVIETIGFRVDDDSVVVAPDGGYHLQLSCHSQCKRVRVIARVGRHEISILTKGVFWTTVDGF